MLTQIRHIQKGLLIVVTIVIVIAFTFLYSNYDLTKGKLGSQDCTFRVYGKCYRFKEAQKLSNSMQVAMQFGMYDFAMDLFGRDRRDQDDTNFIMSLVILRKEASKLGIEPSFEEIQAAIPNLPALKAQPWMNEEIVTNALAANGFSMGDFQELVGDYLAWKKIKDLVSAGVQPLPDETSRLYKAENQRYSVTVVDFDRADLEETVNPSDEDIQKFFEQNTADLNSLPKRGFEMIRFTEGEQPEDATNEQKSNAALDFRKSINKTYVKLAEDSEKFAEIAKAQQNGVSVNQAVFESFAPFEISEAPESLAIEPNVLRGLFSGTRAVGSVTEPFQMSDGSIAVFKISKEIASKPLTLEESKETGIGSNGK